MSCPDLIEAMAVQCEKGTTVRKTNSGAIVPLSLGKDFAKSGKSEMIAHEYRSSKYALASYHHLLSALEDKEPAEIEGIDTREILRVHL